MGITGIHDPGHDGAWAYDTTSLEDLQRLIDTVPTGRHGMRWIHQPDAVLCHAESEVDPPYDDFVSRVDIATVGRRFSGVGGSVTEVLRRHPDGRVTLQLERISAGARPGRTAFRGLALLGGALLGGALLGTTFLGGDDVDMHWLERIDYGADEQRIWIRTVHDPGGPTVHYDGYVAFARVAGRTRIALLACRRLPMPRALTLIRLDRWPWLRRILAESGFRRFFDATTANIMASYRAPGTGVCVSPDPGHPPPRR